MRRHNSPSQTKDEQSYSVLLIEIFRLSLTCSFLQASELFGLFKGAKNKKNPQTYCLRVFVAPPVGLEPTTTRLTAECSTDWAKEEYL